MFCVRRIWLGPILVFTFVLYFFVQRIIYPDHQYGRHKHRIHLNTETYKRRYPVASPLSLPSDPAKSIPTIQYDFSKQVESSEARRTRLTRRDAVKESFLHAWEGYKKHAWAKDEVMPITGKWRNSFGGWGATMVDTMDTLWIMGLKTDFEDCVREVKEIDFTSNTEESLNVFETNIRYLGGLLAAYDISDGRYPILLDKARELGEILYVPFDTPNNMPVTRWNWDATALGQKLGSASYTTLLAELGSLNLEFTRLSQLTGDSKWFDAVERIAKIMAQKQNETKLPGLWPTMVNAKDLDFEYNHFTLGGMADSAYEYLPKQYLLLGGLDDTYKQMYLRMIETAKKALFFRPLTPTKSDILFSGSSTVDPLSGDIIMDSEGQHLTCFLGGMVGIGSQIFSRPSDLPIAKKLVDGCIWAYNATPSGLMPEVFNIARCHMGVEPDPPTQDCTWDEDKYHKAVVHTQPRTAAVARISEVEGGKWWVQQKGLIPPFTMLNDNRYILRPEAIESMFILYRITGDTSLLDSAWTMFQAIERHTRTDIAHAAVRDVRKEQPPKMDRMESFWLAETLKYFYLIYDETDVISLDEYVLNTEAHPFRRPKAGERLGVMTR